MIYVYRCSAGHVNEEFRAVEERSLRRRCSTRGCRRKAWRDVHAERTSRRHVIADIPEHYNRSTDCVIRSRRHLREIQRQRGLTDYDPKDYKPVRLLER